MNRMKPPLAFIVVALISLAGSLSSCATHSCGKVPGTRDPRNFVFGEFTGKSHVYPVAETRSAGAPMLVLHGLGGLDGPTLDWGQALGGHGWKVYMPMLDGEFDRCDPIRHSLRMKFS